MSSNTYFCFCCLSTSNLSCLFGISNEDNCAEVIEDLFSIKISQDYEEESHVCEECKAMLNVIDDFKQRFINTLNVLEGSGLIFLQNDEKNIKHVTKVVEFNDEDDNNVDEQNCEEAFITSVDEIAYESFELTQIIPKQDQKIILKQENSRKNEPSYVVPEDLKCTECGEIQLNTHSYHTHMNMHYPNHVCEMCGKGFLTEKRVKRHIPSHDPGPFKCNICNAEFDKYNTMISHRQRKHSSVSQYCCPHCAQRFSTFTRRQTHLRQSHGRATSRTCPYCEKTFLLSGNLSTHIRNTHQKVKRHFCTHCEASFFKKCDLRAHITTHTGVKEYTCEFCDKSFPRRNALKVHMKVHTGDKKYACTRCDKKFIQKCTLLRHETTHARTTGFNQAT